MEDDRVYLHLVNPARWYGFIERLRK